MKEKIQLVLKNMCKKIDMFLFVLFVMVAGIMILFMAGTKYAHAQTVIPGTISGFVYIDTNRNGNQDIGELGYTGATLILSGPSSATRVTDIFGNALFTALNPGTYTVALQSSSKYSSTTSTSRAVSLVANQNIQVKFGITPLYTVSGTVFKDKDRDGNIDGTDTKLSGVTVTLSGVAQKTTTTDAGGNYSFTGLSAGDYTATVTVPKSPQKYKNTTPVSRTVNVNIDTVINFGMIAIHTLSGKVFIDTNSNGRVNGGEPFYPGATVALSGDSSGTRITDSAGNYVFADIFEGNYVISLQMPTGYRSTSPNLLNISLQANTTTNFGIKQLSLNGGSQCTAGAMEIMFIIDHSVSMEDWNASTGNTKIYDAKQGAIKFVDTVSQKLPTARIGVIQFASGVNYPNDSRQTSVLVPLTTNFTQVKNALNSINTNIQDLGSCHECGIDMANNEIRRTGAQNVRKINIFITDGVANGIIGKTTESSPEEAENAAMVAAIDGVNRLNMLYNVIGIGSGTEINEPFMTQLTSTNGGYYYNNPAYGSIDTIFKQFEDTFITLLGEITGNIFIDTNKNGIKDINEVNYTGSSSILTTGGTMSVSTNGIYSNRDIPTCNPVTLSYTSLPPGYVMTHPKTGPPPSYQVDIGESCNVRGAPGAVCSSSGDISNLNFGITNLLPWFQSTCGDVRIDNGINDPIPSTAASGAYLITTNASCTNPGTAYTGDSSPTLGQGQISSTKWLAGGTTYPEVHKTTNVSGIRSSYTYISTKAAKASITPTNLTTVCTLTNCTLPANLSHGIYQANGDVTLNAFTFPANQNYLFLINGNLTVRGSVIVPNGSTALFSASGNIMIPSNVGVAANVTTASLQGIYSTDKSFIVATAGNCNDLRLNIAGTVITNAALQGGSFQNNRDLCSSDSLYPTVSFLQRLDFFFNLPDIVKIQNTTSQEVAP